MSRTLSSAALLNLQEIVRHSEYDKRLIYQYYGIDESSPSAQAKLDEKIADLISDDPTIPIPAGFPYPGDILRAGYPRSAVELSKVLSDRVEWTAFGGLSYGLAKNTVGELPRDFTDASRPVWLQRLKEGPSAVFLSTLVEFPYATRWQIMNGKDPYRWFGEPNGIENVRLEDDALFQQSVIAKGPRDAPSSLWYVVRTLPAEMITDKFITWATRYGIPSGMTRRAEVALAIANLRLIGDTQITMFMVNFLQDPKTALDIVDFVRDDGNFKLFEMYAEFAPIWESLVKRFAMADPSFPLSVILKTDWGRAMSAQERDDLVSRILNKKKVTF